MTTRSRAFGRRVALDILARTTTLRESRDDARARVAIPYFHDIPQGEMDAFRSFVSQMARHHTFIDYNEAVDRLHNGPIDRPYMSFTFDDGFASNVEAARVLEEFGTTGCFFVPPAFIDSKLTTKEAMIKFGFARGTLEHAMTWADLEQMKSRGHLVENHTLNHPRLSALSDGQISDEVSVAAERIRGVLGECNHFAWPRGTFADFTPHAARAVFDSGHRSCASAVRGAHTTPATSDRSLCIRRDHIMTAWPLLHQRYFIARSSRTATAQSNAWPSGWEV